MTTTPTPRRVPRRRVTAPLPIQALAYFALLLGPILIASYAVSALGLPPNP